MDEQQEPATRADLDRLAAFVRELDRMLHLATARPQGDHRLPPPVLPPLPRPVAGGPGAGRSDPGWMPTRTAAPAGLPDPGIAWVEPVGAAVQRPRDAASPAPADPGDRSRPVPDLAALRELQQPTLATGPVPAEPEPLSESSTEPDRGRPRPAIRQVPARAAGRTAPADLPPAARPEPVLQDDEQTGEGAPPVAPPPLATASAPTDRPTSSPVLLTEPRPHAPESSRTESPAGHEVVGSPEPPRSVPPSGGSPATPHVPEPGPGRPRGEMTDHPGAAPSWAGPVDGSDDGRDLGSDDGSDDRPDDAVLDRSDGLLSDPPVDEWEPGPEPLPVDPATVPGPLRGAPGPRRSAVSLTAGEANRVGAELERSYLDRTLRRSR